MQEKELNLTSPSEVQGMRLDVFLHNMLQDISRTKIKEMIQQSLVSVNGKAITRPSYRLKGGERVKVILKFKGEEKLEPEKIDIEIIYYDLDIIVVNKPAGILTHPTPKRRKGTLVNALLFHFPELQELDAVKPGIVHRLDKDTSGIMVVGRNYQACANLSRSFKKREVVKKYLAIVKGRIAYQEGIIDQPVGRAKILRKRMIIDYGRGRDALTYYKLITHLRDYSFVLLYPKTGRTHQLRVHMRYIGHPIIGDRVYGVKSDLICRPALHSYTITFPHPRSGKIMSFKANPAQDFINVLKNLGFDLFSFLKQEVKNG